jgi:hypothetical protein
MLRRKFKPWLAEDVAELERMASSGHSTQEIASALGRTREAVDGKLYRLGKNTSGQPSAPRKARKRRVSGASFFLS